MIRTKILKRKKDTSRRVENVIQERAYYIWKNKGSVSNSALDNWLEAERQLKKEKAV